MRKYAILLPYKHTEDNGLELKHAIRSWEKNLLNWSGELYLYGDKEAWFNTKIKRTDVVQKDHSECCNNGLQKCYYNEYLKYVKAFNDKKLPDEVIIMNDDFYVNKPMAFTHNLYKRDLLRNSMAVHARCKNKTGLFLKAKGETYYNFELHVPMIVNKKNMAKALELKRDEAKRTPVLLQRSLYANLYTKIYEAREYIDQKTYGEELSNDTWISTNVYTPELAKRFNRKSSYEK